MYVHVHVVNDNKLKQNTINLEGIWDSKNDYDVSVAVHKLLKKIWLPVNGSSHVILFSVYIGSIELN